MTCHVNEGHEENQSPGKGWRTTEGLSEDEVVQEGLSEEVGLEPASKWRGREGAQAIWGQSMGAGGAADVGTGSFVPGTGRGSGGLME